MFLFIPLASQLTTSIYLFPRFGYLLNELQLFDTAGVDDVGNLGGKKVQKTIQCLKEVRSLLVDEVGG